MDVLLEKGVITELACGTNFAYVLSDQKQFQLTDYKVLQSQNNSNFIKCIKMLHNGKTEFFYMLDKYTPFSSILSSIHIESFMTIVANLLKSIIEVKNNGFLSCQNIDISFEKIFVDMNTLKVKLVYVPINKKEFEDYYAFENKLRTSLIKLINSLHTGSTDKMTQLAVNLADGMLSLEEINNKIRNIKEIKESDEKSNKESTGNSGHKHLRIMTVNTSKPFELLVDKDNFIIGKNATKVDGVITFNRAISRVHCKVIKQNGQFMLVDLGSVNGTYVNSLKLIPNHPHPIENGDMICLANSKFQINVE